jgi:hypothetical protein
MDGFFGRDKLAGEAAPTWAVLASLGLVVALACITVLWASSILRARLSLRAVCHLLMSVGMGVMLLTML